MSRKFALLSLVTIAVITTAQVWVQWSLLKEDVLAWERTVTVDAIRAAVYSRVRPEDFRNWRQPDARERFQEVFGHVLSHLEIQRIKLYDAEMRVVWSDEERLLGARFTDNEELNDAMRGQTVANLQRAVKPENLFERDIGQTVELYVPIVFPGGPPGRVAGVVELYKSPARVLASVSHDRWIIVRTSLAGALLLYAVLFSIVHRASRRLGRLEEQLRTSARMAALGEVSAAVAHGIRNPLANIRAMAQVARDQVGEDPAMARYLAAITAEVDRLSGWLKDLLQFVKPFELRLARVDIHRMLDDALGVLAERITRGEVKVERHFAPELPVVEADDVQLQQVFLGVLENALDAVPTGGTLGVETERAGAGVRVTIHDGGAGIPAERLSRVFEPFFTTKRGGTGLGLAIARKVVDGHGGTIRLESEPGMGTTVTITLPLKAVTR